jgi:hemerythrin
LADTNHDFLRASAYDYLKFYFPNVPEYEIHSLLNCPMVSMTAGENLFKKDATYKHVYLVLTGSVELVYPETGIENNLSAGSLVGYFIDDNDLIAKATCQATSYITALKIPLVMYLNFVKRHHLVEDFNKLEHIVSVLSTTWAFSENISLPIYIKLAQLVNQHKYDKGANLSISQSSGFNLILSGKAALLTSDGGVVENLKKGDFFGAENILPSENEEVLEIFFLEDTELYHIPIEVVMNIPIVYWKIHHTAEKRSEMMI